MGWPNALQPRLDEKQDSWKCKLCLLELPFGAVSPKSVHKNGSYFGFSLQQFLQQTAWRQVSFRSALIRAGKEVAGVIAWVYRTLQGIVPLDHSGWSVYSPRTCRAQTVEEKLVPVEKQPNALLDYQLSSLTHSYPYFWGLKLAYTIGACASFPATAASDSDRSCTCSIYIATEYHNHELNCL